MKRDRLPPQSTLSEMLLYDPETGHLTWRARPRGHFKTPGAWKSWNGRYPGTSALSCIDTEGYLSGCLNSVGRVKAHRIIWKLIHGVEPEALDHINHIRTDNRLENLRAVSAADNARNVLCSRQYPMGLYRRRNGWMVSIRRNGRIKYLGDFDCFAKAVRARREAEAAAGFHEYHGRLPA